MKKTWLLISIVLLSLSIYGQAVGYQGKRFIIQAGYIPANNMAAILFQTNLEDDHYTSYEQMSTGVFENPLIFVHLPKVEAEYVVSRYGSVFLRYNPFKFTTNIEYLDDNSFEPIDLVGIETKGNMFSFGYRNYLSGNIAPLGSHFAYYLTYFKYNSAYGESKFAEDPAPEVFLEYPSFENSMVGLFGCYGVKNIFWDKLVLDFQIDGGWFFKKRDKFEYAEYEGEFSPYYIESSREPDYYGAFNTKPFFYITPSINIGYLAF